MSFIYILVDIDLNMANAPMHTENLTPPADALHDHRVRYAASKVTDRALYLNT